MKFNNIFKWGYVCFGGVCLFILGFLIFSNNKPSGNSINNKQNILKSDYAITSNSLTDFDLYFLKLENERKNKVYSPLSIKYALQMLSEGSKGDSKSQIDNILGSYIVKKYNNNSNMSFANALFIKDSYKDSIHKNYINTLSGKYNADVIYDTFENADTLNSWVSNKTFKLIDNMFDNVADSDFILVNALAIDMEWVNQIQSESKIYEAKYKHENYSLGVNPLTVNDYTALDFNNKKAKAVKFAASINKYDIVNTLGEENIRKTVGAEYEKWLKTDDVKMFIENNPNQTEIELDVNKYLDTYIEELNEGYKQISSSTDFYFYDDSDVKVFAKDLKEYDGTTLQYVGIMPKNENLDDYIKNINAEKLNSIINNLKTVEIDNFKEGVITKIVGVIPMFNFDYELKLKDDLKTLGIKDIFNPEKSDLSNLTSTQNAYIGKASHKANIAFSNDGIKASAATALGGLGSVGGGFEYLYDVPVETIDLTFDNPYLFLIRDKNSGEVWFAGTVYEPEEYIS